MTFPTMTDTPGTFDPNAVLMRQLAERAAHDPMAGLLLARLQSGEADEEPDRLEVLERRFGALLRANQQLREAVLAADRMSAWVARMVGACPQCWGLAADCRTCGGRGTPGYDHPDIGELVDWISPALRRSGLTLTRSGAPGSDRAPLTINTEQEMT